MTSILDVFSERLYNQLIADNIYDEFHPSSIFVRNVGMQLVNKCGLPEAQNIYWRFYVLKDLNVNCFSLGNGVIVVQEGMLRYIHTPDELAAILAHEISHVIARHALERMSKVFGKNNIIFMQTQEVEADYIGLSLMVRAGFDPNVAINLWRELAKILPDQDNPQGVTVFSHPSFRLRLENAKEAIPLIIANHSVPSDYFQQSSYLPEPEEE